MTTRRRALRWMIGVAGGAVLLVATPVLRARGKDPQEIARRWGLKVTPLPEKDLREPHDLAG